MNAREFKLLTDAAIRRMLASSDSVRDAADTYGVSVDLFRREMKRRKITSGQVFDAEADGAKLASDVGHDGKD
jgi:predicted HTH domain antitoxin